MISIPDESILIQGLWESPKAFLASELAKKKSVLLLTNGMKEDHFFDNLSYFCPSQVVEFPAWETLPGEEIAPSPDIIGKRFLALHELIHRKEHKIVLCPLHSFLQKIPPKDVIKPLLKTWKRGMHLAFDSIPALLVELGYKREAVCSDKGEFAIRGGILDLFPVSSSDPYRIEFFGDEIETIKTFDPIGQKSIHQVEEIFLSPANELMLIQKANRLVSILDYLDEPILFWDDLIAAEDTYVKIKSMPGAKTPYFYSLNEKLKKLDDHQHIFCSEFALEETFEMFNHTFKAKRFKHPFYRVEDCFQIDEDPDPKFRFLFLNANETEEKEIQEKLSKIKLPKNTRWEKGYLTSGYALFDLVIIPNIEITKKERIRRQKWRSTYHTPAAEFHALEPGDLVVHYHSGIGRYLGIETQKNHLGKETEFLALGYQDGAKQFIPLSQSHLISRYIGSSDTPPLLSDLGSKRWQKTKMSAQAQIVGYANDLLELYAKREVVGGFFYPSDGDLMQQFENDFPYEETLDQVNAIDMIKTDMMSKKSMDRLICGDVGYGKTEVAMRAAFKAVADGKKQVAVLVPTTVLALQHFENFSQRMSGFGVSIDLISRLSSAKEIKKTLEKLKNGQIDILIGTHRLLSKDVHFKDLGMLIIDEEQRFGVRAKEHLKKMKVGVDCLTLSATPIPRTLYMSLVSAKDMSVINTPPQDRLPIKTIIAEMDPEIIQNAILRELARGGQVFYIHNRVESIYVKAEEVQKLIPNAKVGIVHGQMSADAVDDIFHQLKQNAIQILIATTIVENGVDIPNANTILIEKADTYGLADLYQLRGRVGRWNRSAYAYFLIPKNKSLAELSRKRLQALVEASGYGGGMKIAHRDLEIRGAGDILGVQQSGQVSAVGFHLYCKMLKRAINAIKQKQPISFNETKMEFSFDAKIPDDYINEVSLRMEIYHRLGEANSFEIVDEIEKELIDRFGKFPESVFWLLEMSKLRIFASQHQFTLLKFNQMTLLAQRQKGKEITQEKIIIPQKVQKPETIGSYVMKELVKRFGLPS